MLSKDIARAEDEARAVEEQGLDTAWTGESSHDPFAHLALAARATSHIGLGTSVAIAFARTPLVMAHLGWDLQVYSRGRFVLGMGTQVKAHVERRFGMPWSRPAARMREYVLAMRAVWSSWTDGTPLDFRGEFYEHTLMTPFFAPERHEWGPPPVLVAGVGALMTEVAGEVCDGFLFHPFTTSRYLEEVTLPALERGRRKAGRAGPFRVAGEALVAAGHDDVSRERALAGARGQLAFYASTPAYRPVLEQHGWQDLQPELARLAREGRWAEQAALIDEAMVDAFCAVGTPETVADKLVQKYGGFADDLVLQAPRGTDRAVLADVARAARERAAAGSASSESEGGAVASPS
jgi:probable F420-dependent oxidoreductase